MRVISSGMLVAVFFLGCGAGDGEVQTDVDPLLQLESVPEDAFLSYHWNNNIPDSDDNSYDVTVDAGGDVQFTGRWVAVESAETTVEPEEVLGLLHAAGELGLSSFDQQEFDSSCEFWSTDSEWVSLTIRADDRAIQLDHNFGCRDDEFRTELRALYAEIESVLIEPGWNEKLPVGR